MKRKIFAKGKVVKSKAKKVAPKVVSKKVSNKEKHISFVLDETGSMMSIKDKTIKDFNEYLQEVKRAKSDAVFTLTKFNANKVEVVYTKKPLKEVPALTASTYNPTDSTPLYDAIGRTVKALEVDEGKQEILVVILTDGEENASKEYDKKAIKALMKEKETKGWTFVYLGVGEAAWAEGQKLGVALYAQTVTAGRAMNIGSGATMAFMKSGRSGTQYFMSKGENKK